MYTLRLLGTAAIEGSHGPVSGRAAQGRRLALLALLALARGHPITRDKLVAILWPEASPDRARPQLSDALYVLRSGLGEDAIRNVGDGLTLNPDVVRSDVALFERMLEDGHLEEAEVLYRGPLMDGFHIREAVEFENWLDAERAHIDRQYARALESLAEAAESAGDTAAAVLWWRKRAAHDPFNGRIALRLMRALETAGDRAGALQHARIHAALLREEFDAEPDADVAAFADRLRLEPPPAPKLITATSAAAPMTGPGATPAVPPATPASAPTSAAASAALERDGAGAAARRRVPGLRRRSFVLAGAAVLALTTLAFAVSLARRGAAPAPARSVGVLPFVNMSADPANTYFSDGLSEQIILALSRVDGLQVAARTSTFALRNRELGVRAIGDTLGVQAVLEGSVLADGDRLRVIAQLIDARTGYHIWSQQYDGSLRDALAVQDSIAAAIAGALHLRLTGEQQRSAPPGLVAYDLYLRGLYLRNGLADDGLHQASQYFDSAIALEPRFAHAWAAKASVIAPLAYFGYARRDSVVAEMRTVTARALELDPALGEAHVALGILKLFFDWDFDGARRALERAIELNPNDAHAWHHLANYHASAGALDEALRARARAALLDPLNARTHIVLAKDHAVDGNTALAEEHARRAAQLDPVNPLLLGTGPNLPTGLPEVFLLSGRTEQAIEEYVRIAALRGATREELNALHEGWAAAGLPGFWRAWLKMDMRLSGASMNSLRMAAALLVSGDTAQGLDWLDRAYAERNPALVYLRREPVFARMRGHPRIERVARAMKLPD